MVALNTNTNTDKKRERKGKQNKTPCAWMNERRAWVRLSQLKINSRSRQRRRRQQFAPTQQQSRIKLNTHAHIERAKEKHTKKQKDVGIINQGAFIGAARWIDHPTREQQKQHNTRTHIDRHLTTGSWRAIKVEPRVNEFNGRRLACWFLIWFDLLQTQGRDKSEAKNKGCTSKVKWSELCDICLFKQSLFTLFSPEFWGIF